MQYTKYSITNVKSKHSTPYMLCNILINGAPPHSNTCRAAGYSRKRHLPFSCAASGFGTRRPMTRRGALRLTAPSCPLLYILFGIKTASAFVFSSRRLSFSSPICKISHLPYSYSCLSFISSALYALRHPVPPLDCHGCPLRQKGPRYRGPSCFLLCFSLNIRGR